MARTLQTETLIRRHLAAFGPASVMQLQAWSGISVGCANTSTHCDRSFRVFRGEQGTELFDLPDARLADADLAALVCFLPAYHNFLLGHADRTRIIADETASWSCLDARLVPPAIVVDGFVRGTWSINGPTLRVCPFRPSTRTDATAVLEEAERLLPFIAADHAQRHIVIEGSALRSRGR